MVGGKGRLGGGVGCEELGVGGWWMWVVGCVCLVGVGVGWFV